ncbi:cyclin-dependent kinase inhibitor 1 [Lingula anatina]|uniref:Cyclin-dependent kinase inhibitor 1 n=1 Tax=Lingula anatina TaxID=7574 RepID=A0A1S3K478_LINAN|nr:cyclin-dependent kinase inhibitor 1 [Lingula anatina]|eukprot:XP_013417061.1 cyclin-dependent kinase inhibitor 1 [Lingula anatina]
MAVYCRRSFKMDITPSKSVRRRLDFGDERPDEAQVILELKDQARIIDEEKKRLWNFDFELEEPLEGNWLWERCCVPVESAQNDFVEKQESSHTDSENSDCIVGSTSSSVSSTALDLSVVQCVDNSFFSQVSERTPTISSSQKPSIRQQKITDMLKLKKRKLISSMKPQQSSRDNKKPKLEKNAS